MQLRLVGGRAGVTAQVRSIPAVFSRGELLSDAAGSAEPNAIPPSSSPSERLAPQLLPRKHL